MTDEYPYRSPPDAKTWQPIWPHAASPDTPPPVNAEADWTLGWIVGLSLSILTFSNLAMLPTAESLSATKPGFHLSLGMSFVCFAAGSIVGQSALLAIFVVWVSAPIWQRLAWQAVLVWLAFTALCLGVCSIAWREVTAWRDGVVAFALCLPLLLLFSQAVPWFFRLFLNWRIELASESPRSTAASRAERLSIRDYMVGTVLVAVAMAMARAGKPASTAEANYWSLWITTGLVLAALSLIVVVPIVHFTLGVRRVHWSIVGVIALTTLASAPAIYFLRGVPLPPVPLMFAIPALMGGFTLTVAVPLWIARRCGYRLAIRRNQTFGDLSG